MAPTKNEQVSTENTFEIVGIVVSNFLLNSSNDAPMKLTPRPNVNVQYHITAEVINFAFRDNFGFVEISILASLACLLLDVNLRLF